jgi:2,3-bisphosphoglycerate-dependent phosphoglycerate mutase
VAIELVFETHSTTLDNEQGHATGWLPGQLSEQGRAQAQQLGRRRRDDGITAVFSSDLTRAVQTASHLDQPYPGGESWRQAITRVGRFLTDLPLRWNEQRILIIGHVATRWGLDHFISGIPLEDLAEQDFAWQEGWEYRIS